MNKASDFIRKLDPELADFLDEELSKYPEMPDCFNDYDYIPTQDELKIYNEEQLEYLQMSANIDESDAIYDGGELYEKLHKRNVKIRKMIQEELKRRNEI